MQLTPLSYSISLDTLSNQVEFIESMPNSPSAETTDLDCPPLEFACITSCKILYVAHPRFTLNEWEKIQPGINIIGFCATPSCPSAAARGRICRSYGDGSFDMRSITLLATCPGCLSPLSSVVGCVFWHCKLHIEGKFVEGGKYDVNSEFHENTFFVLGAKSNIQVKRKYEYLRILAKALPEPALFIPINIFKVIKRVHELNIFEVLLKALLTQPRTPYYPKTVMLKPQFFYSRTSKD